MITENNKKYNALNDAKLLIKPLKYWSLLGFLRGFLGLRKNILEKNELLPSFVFQRYAENNIGEDNLEQKKKYIDDVVEYLIKEQSLLATKHYDYYLRGILVDFALSAILIFSMFCLFFLFGYKNIITFVVLFLIVLKIFLIRVIAKYIMNNTKRTFSLSEIDIKLPWKELNLSK